MRNLQCMLVTGGIPYYHSVSASSTVSGQGGVQPHRARILLHTQPAVFTIVTSPDLSPSLRKIKWDVDPLRAAQVGGLDQLTQ